MNFDRESLIAIDVETSGPNPYEHRLLAVALAPFDRPDDAQCWYVRHNPLVLTDVARGYFQNYREDWERKATPPKVAAQQIESWLNERPASELMLVGHNVGFDFSFLKQLAPSFSRLSHRSIDTHTLLRTLAWMGCVPVSACSSTGALEYFDIAVPAGQRHTALGDALATRDLFLRISDLLGGDDRVGSRAAT